MDPPTRTMESQWQSKIEKREAKKNAPQNIPTQDAGLRTGKSEAIYAGLPPSSFRAGDILSSRCLSSLNEGSQVLSILLTPSPPTEFSLILKPS